MAAYYEDYNADRLYANLEAPVSSAAYDPDAPCYCTGTRILTTRGEVAVEALMVGDLAVTASGQERSILWIGSRTVNCRRHLKQADIQPVRITAHAIADNKPARDLRVSPGHAICLDVVGEVLIPASALVNGATIVQEDVDSVTYWHVELEGHDILIAEGQAAESYLEMDNRSFFAGTEIQDFDRLPDPASAQRTHADFCRPFHDRGTLLEVVQAQMRVRAKAFGWKLTTPETWADVRLEVDGAIVLPNSCGLTASFTLPADASDVWLVCPTSVPCHVSENPDGRVLGLCLSGLALADDAGATRVIELDDPLLCVGFHEMQPGHRWTASRARLPAALLKGLTGDVLLRLDLVCAGLPRWVAPEVAVPVFPQMAAPPLRLVAA